MTFAGTQRISKSSTKRSAALVRKRRTLVEESPGTIGKRTIGISRTMLGLAALTRSQHPLVLNERKSELME
jgi:hypothetical protein